MELGLCMTVKNESENIEACLGEIYDLFTEIHIFDTGSTDNTVEMLRSQFDIEASFGSLEEQRCYSLSDLRNQGFERLSTPWIFCLDADERVERDALHDFIQYADPTVAGYFTPWNTHTPHGIIEDYKLSLFQRGYQKLGLVHDNVQASFRQRGAEAAWYSSLIIDHFPALHRQREKHEYYESRLNCALQKDSGWMRYHWFLGYRYFRQHKIQPALQHLEKCFSSHSDFFPVEVLNSAMVLAAIYTQIGQFEKAQAVLKRAIVFHCKKANDFEVRINADVESWLTTNLFKVQKKQCLQAPQFAY